MVQLGRALAAALLVVMVLVPWVGRGEDAPPEPLAAAEAALQAGDAAEAVRLYEGLLEVHGPNADLLYNLGVAYAAGGDPALATLAFERSLALSPGAADAEEQLLAAREAVQSELLSVSTGRAVTRGEPQAFVLWRFFRRWSADAVAIGLLVSWLGLFGGLSARRLPGRGAAREVVLAVVVVCALAATVTGGYLVGRWQTEDVRPAVVVGTEPVLYESPIELAATHRADDLYRGALVRVMDTREAWLEIELADGTRGWVPGAVVAEVRVERWR